MGSIAATTRPKPIQKVREDNAVGDGADGGGIFARWRSPWLPQWGLARCDRTDSELEDIGSWQIAHFVSEKSINLAGTDYGPSVFR